MLRSVPAESDLVYAACRHASEPDRWFGAHRLRGCEAGHVRIAILDVAGRRIATLADRPEFAGAHSVRWSGRRDDASLAALGCYFVRLDAGGRRFTKALVLTR